MELKEVACMVNLININYHRRMLYFWINVVVIVGSLFECLRTSGQANAVIFFLIFLVFGLRFVSAYCFGGYPWSIKKTQMAELMDAIDEKAKFSELSTRLPECFGM